MIAERGGFVYKITLFRASARTAVDLSEPHQCLGDVFAGDAGS